MGEKFSITPTTFADGRPAFLVSNSRGMDYARFATKAECETWLRNFQQSFLGSNEQKEV